MGRCELVESGLMWSLVAGWCSSPSLVVVTAMFCVKWKAKRKHMGDALPSRAPTRQPTWTTSGDLGGAVRSCRLVLVV